MLLVETLKPLMSLVRHLHAGTQEMAALSRMGRAPDMDAPRQDLAREGTVKI